MICSVALALVPLLSAPFRVTPTREEKVAAGQRVPDFEFRTVVGGDGRVKLSEFRGQPVLIVWYSTVFAGVEGARIAVDIEQETNGDVPESRLVVFLMEIKNHDPTYLRALQMAELPGAACRLLHNQDLPVTYDDTTGFPPKMVLIGADGTLLYAGSYQRANEVKKLLKAELVKVEKGWGEDPLVRKARALAWGEWKLDEARTLISAARTQSEGSAGANPELVELALELETRFATLERAVGYALEQGEPQRAALALSRLTLAAGAHTPWVERAKAVAERHGREAGGEAELEKRLDALLKPAAKSKPKEALAEKLRSFASGEAAGTKVGARAGRLAEAVVQANGKL